jgi:hypothetical protein
MMRFRRSKITRPVGAGLTYCAGFDLAVRADAPVRLTIEVHQQRSGGTDLRPPRRLGSFYLQASPSETVLRLETDEGALGHPCAELIRFVVSIEGSGISELVIMESQTACEAQVVGGDGWTASYPVFTGPNGVRLEYRPLHGYLD